MTEFLKLAARGEALKLLLDAIPKATHEIEEISTLSALGRVLASEIVAPNPMPEFPRSTVDGYAVRSVDTLGASDSLPGYLRIIGEVPMGSSPDMVIQPGTCAEIHTGGMLPDEADAVLMLEYTQPITSGDLPGNGTNQIVKKEIEFTRSVAYGENTIRVGEDISVGQKVFLRGIRITPEVIGGCLAIGKTSLQVIKKPVISILSSGDEVIPPEKKPSPGQVRDINSGVIAALVARSGGYPIARGIVPDNLPDLKRSAAETLNESDALVITAGSSASARDMTAEAIDSLGPPGVLVHGINIRPGKPTILAVCNGKPVIGLPGNPVSALIISKLLVTPVIEKLLGLISKPVYPILARIEVNVPSQAGREDWVAVKLTNTGDNISKYDKKADIIKLIAEPVFTKSNLIFSLSNADGIFCIPPDMTGISAGEVIEVFPI